jgi:hypothetical protein
MKLEDMTLKELTELLNLLKTGDNKSHPFKIGQAYLIRTVTHYYTGRLTEVHNSEIVIEDAAWIADTGRFSESLESGQFSEIEPIDGPVIIGRGAIIDACELKKDLPRSVK